MNENKVVGWVHSPDGISIDGGLHRSENPHTDGCYDVRWNPPSVRNAVVVCVGYSRVGDCFEGVFNVIEEQEDDNLNNEST